MENKPFPQAIKWTNCIQPNISQDTLNNDVVNFYNYWKSRYLKPSAYTSEAYYIHGENTGGSPDDKGTSEGQGYGMIITVLMAGYDPQAKTYYDGLFKMFDTHRSKINLNLMGWLIDREEKGSGTYSSATDGDMDIAYSLLLADKQWGSAGDINYFAEAVKIITDGIKKSNINANLRTNLGDWDEDEYNSRSSDWMTAHFRAFHQATGDAFWNQVADNVYIIMNTITNNYAHKTGLMPDFVFGEILQPGKPKYPESKNDADYYYNACRVPLRIVMDYAHYGNTAAKTAVTRMLNWIKSSAENNPANIKSGYKLDGTPLSEFNYQSTAFIAPFVAASVSDAAHQSFLNDGWNFIKNLQKTYFEDTYNLLCMLFISGNWWMP